MAAVDGGLELQQDQDVDPAARGGPDSPEHVGVPLAEMLGDEAGGEAFQGGEVEVAGDVTRGRAQGVLHGARVGEEVLVRGVVPGVGGPFLLSRHGGRFPGGKDGGSRCRGAAPAGPSVVRGEWCRGAGGGGMAGWD